VTCREKNKKLQWAIQGKAQQGRGSLAPPQIKDNVSQEIEKGLENRKGKKNAPATSQQLGMVWGGGKITVTGPQETLKKKEKSILAMTWGSERSTNGINARWMTAREKGRYCLGSGN